MGFLSDLFPSKKEKAADPVNLGLLQVDMHSHFIPGIDDGATDLNDTMNLLAEMKAFGYRKVITTPHIYYDLYRNNSSVILSGLEKVKAEIKNRGLEIEIEAAAEYFADSHFEELLEKKELLSFGKNYVLFEISFAAEPANLGRVIFHLHLQGYKPIIAHPERYEYWHNDFSRYESLLDKDTLIQVNINSLTGNYGVSVKKIAEKLIDYNMVSFIGSDCHHLGHVQLMNVARTNPSLKRLIESGRLLNATL